MKTIAYKLIFSTSHYDEKGNKSIQKSKCEIFDFPFKTNKSYREARYSTIKKAEELLNHIENDKSFSCVHESYKNNNHSKKYGYLQVFLVHIGGAISVFCSRDKINSLCNI